MALKIPAVHMRAALRDGLIVRALVAEFLGVMLFQLMSGTVTHGAFETAATFAAIMFFTQHISGGHLNPVVSLAAAGTGHIDINRGLLYAMAQILGAITGALIQVGLDYDAHFGSSGSDACIHPGRHVSGPQVWGWELVLTFFFLAVMYSAIFVAPGHGSLAPLAAGLTLFAALSTGGYFTGMSPLNPARIIANMLVFRCNVSWGWTYLMAHLAAVGAGVAWVWPVYGLGMYMGGSRPDVGRGTAGTLREGLLAGGGMEEMPAGSPGYGQP